MGEGERKRGGEGQEQRWKRAMSEEKEGGGERKGGGEGEEARVEVERRESEGKRGGRCEEEEEERKERKSRYAHTNTICHYYSRYVHTNVHTAAVYTYLRQQYSS